MKLLQWNIQWGRGVDGRVNLDNIVSHVKRLGDFDIACFQEVASAWPELPDNGDMDQFSELRRHFPDHQAIVGIATDIAGSPARRGFGNMILSRYPVQQVFRHLLPWPADPEVPSMQRMALEATLDTPLGLVRVTTAHLEYFSLKQRHAQVQRLRELHKEAFEHARRDPEREAKDAPFYYPRRGAQAIITGDLNCLPDSDEIKLLTSPIDTSTPRYCDAWELAHRTGPRAPTVGVHDKKQWPDDPFTFDYVLVSEDLASRVKDVQVDALADASDHQPMLLVLE